MKSPRIETPTGQNWSCHGCTDCCRGHLLVAVLSEGEGFPVGKDVFTTAADGKKYAPKP